MNGAVAMVLAGLLAADPSAALKHESFDADPQWEAVNNRQLPAKANTATQDFGYSPTHFAGKAPGEIGGRVQRSTTPASYAAKIHKTLDDKLTASGSFAITKSSAGGGLFFGYFHGDQPGGGGRPIGSLGFNMDFESHGGRIALRLITAGNRSCGTFLTPYVPGKFRPTPIRADATVYHWKLDYDPQGAGGNGRFRCEFNSDKADPDELLRDPKMTDVARAEALIRYPKTTVFTVDLPPGYKQEGATFDRFGISNMMKSGGFANIYFDDLVIDGVAEDFAKDPGWIAQNNRGTFAEEDVAGYQNFGFSPMTAHAGGSPGEVGGAFWRGEKNWGYYADRVGPLSLEQRIEVKGKVCMVVGGPDADSYIGFFNSADRDQPPVSGKNFVGVHIGGPTRVGHYFIPAFTSATGARQKVEAGPLIKPGRTYNWSLVYDPLAQSGLGAITVTLGDESVSLPLKKGMKAQGATLDRFGMFSAYPGGQMVKIFMDDLTYTATQK